MEGADRFQSLATKAHVLGALDFCQSHRYDSTWLLKEELVLHQIESDNLLRLKSLRHAQHAAGAGAGGELYQHHFDRACAEFKGLSELLFPWVDFSTDEKTSQHVKMWEETFGIKMGSPEWDKLVKKYDRIAELYKNKKRAKRG